MFTIKLRDSDRRPEDRSQIDWVRIAFMEGFDSDVELSVSAARQRGGYIIS